MYKPKIFIGSSKSALPIAEAVKKGLGMRGCGEIQVWNKGVFDLNQGFLETLMTARTEFDFAVLIWSGADTTIVRGKTQDSPRDNVVFETGLFMGGMGRHRVFVIFDQSVDLKIPSDFLGITFAPYDGRAFQSSGYAAVQEACKQVAEAMMSRPLTQLVGEWTSRYGRSAFADHAFVMDDVDIAEARGGIVMASQPHPSAKSYVAYGHVHKPQQIIGEWRHGSDDSFIEGLFMLTVNRAADMMAGYCTARDDNDALIFGTWVLVKKDGRESDVIEKRLVEGERQLLERTLHGIG